MLRASLVAILLASSACQPDASGVDGPALFERTCARCHGRDGTGDPLQKQRLGVPDMTDPEWQSRHSDDDMRRTVREGSHSRRMPGFGEFYQDPQLDALIRHIRGLRR